MKTHSLLSTCQNLAPDSLTKLAGTNWSITPSLDRYRTE